MGINSSEIIAKYSAPLPCRSCQYALKPIGKYSRAESLFCEKHPTYQNRKPSGVLFSGLSCEFYIRTTYSPNPVHTDDDDWVTINGTHVLINEEGVAQSGGKLKGKSFGSAKSERKSKATSAKPEKVETSKSMKPKSEYKFFDDSGYMLSEDDWISENVEALMETYKSGGSDAVDLEYWKGLTEQSTKDVHEIDKDYHDIQDEFVDAVGDNYLAHWFVQEDPAYKPRIVEQILRSSETRNQALNLMYENYKQYMDLSGSGEPLSFASFMTTPITGLVQ